MSGLSQDPLFEEPPWPSFWPAGTKVRSVWTQNTGKVVTSDPLGRCIWIEWAATEWRDSYKCLHGSERGLERL